MNYDFSTPPAPKQKNPQKPNLKRVVLWTLLIISMVTNTVIQLLQIGTIYQIVVGGFILIFIALLGYDYWLGKQTR